MAHLRIQIQAISCSRNKGIHSIFAFHRVHDIQIPSQNLRELIYSLVSSYLSSESMFSQKSLSISSLEGKQLCLSRRSVDYEKEAMDEIKRKQNSIEITEVAGVITHSKHLAKRQKTQIEIPASMNEGNFLESEPFVCAYH